MRIFIILLLEGFTTISVEILAIRQLIPEVGNSVIITSLIIGIFLLCLAYGYQAGGRCHKNLQRRLQRNFLTAAFAIGIGLSFIFIQEFFALGHQFKITLIWILVLYLLAVIAPIVYLLGQTVPITMTLLHQQQSIGAIGGRVLFLSTLGSFLGAVLTSLVLMNFLGVAWTVIINFMVLAFLALLITDAKQLPLIGLLVLTTGLITYLVNRGLEKQSFIGTTTYSNYAVLQNAPLVTGQIGHLLFTNNAPSSFIDANKKAFPYIERIKQILFNELKLSNKHILVLGAGGFTLSAENTYGNHFDYVDIDPRIYNLVKKYFLNPIQGRFIAADARRYIKEHPHSYDVIVSDAFSNLRTIPMQLLTLEYFWDIKQALKPNGLAVFNIVAPPLLNSPYGKRIDNTLRRAFGSCTATPLKFSEDKTSNIIYICQNNAESDDKTIYTDDLNRSSFDVYKQIQP